MLVIGAKRKMAPQPHLLQEVLLMSRQAASQLWKDPTVAVCFLGCLAHETGAPVGKGLFDSSLSPRGHS